MTTGHYDDLDVIMAIQKTTIENIDLHSPYWGQVRL
jgi:hypothetical protein